MSKYKQVVVAIILVLASALSMAGKKPSANKPPAVSLTAPSNGATFSAPATISLNATASDTDGTISKVEFYRGTTLIGTSVSAPYGVTWSNATAGTYSLTAKATDNGGATTTSTAVSITVTGDASVANPITSPANGAVVYGSTVNVGGTFTGDPTTTTVLVDNGNTTRLATLNNNNFTATLPLYAGSNTLVASVVRRDKTSDTGSITITGNDYPKIAWKAPATSVFDAPATMTLGVDALSPSGTIAKVDFYKNGTLQATKTTPPYETTLTNVAAGSYMLAATATDNNGYNATATRSVTVNGTNTLPTVQLVAPSNGAVFSPSANIAMTAAANDADGYITQVEFFQNGALLAATNVEPYSFTWNNVAAGSYALTARATDDRGGSVTSSPVNVSVGTPNNPPTVAFTSPVDGATYIAPATIALNVNASDTDGAIAKVEFYNGATLIGTVTSTPYTFNWTNVATGSYTLTTKATDNLGAVVTSASKTVTVILPNGGGMTSPDPSLQAPPVDSAGPTTIAASTAFLYTGPNAVQTGVASDAIDSKRVAVLRGMVSSRDGQPLSGVTISVNGHPELGQTTSRSNGMFDMAVNGGASLTVNYAASGYLPVQRTMQVPTLDYSVVPSVVMIPVDTQATTVNLSTMSAPVIARGGVVVDSAGTRQATVFIPQGTTATMTLPDGTQQVLNSITVRATEYTVGSNGPNTMPGTLPATSGYTYAVENSIDEAVAAGATAVNFNQPVYQYVDNYLNFPVGGAVPTGYYDRQRTAWIASDNGKVIKVLGTAGGLATLDIDGSGQAASSTQLAALNITDAERAKLSSLYSAGASFWRIPMKHFSPWDHNWPFGPPSDATPPMVPNPHDHGKMDKPNCASGSIIECQNQSLGESVPVVGTPFTLNYKSSRTMGAGTMSVVIPLTGGTLPASLKRVELEVSIMGRQFKQSFPVLTNQTFSFAWDGVDVYGRPVFGVQTATIRVGYVYDGVYRSPANSGSSFANFGGDVISGDRVAREITLWKQTTTGLGNWSAKTVGLGGWTLDVHHFYDGSTLFLGDGRTRTGKELGDIINSVTSGNGQIKSLAIDVYGNLYYSDYLKDNGRVIYKVAPDGSKTILPKSVGVSYGVVATDSQGNLFAWDNANHVLHKITQDGTTTIIAGNGNEGFSGDGGPATLASFSGSTGFSVGPAGIAIDSQGNIFISDPGNYRVRKISPDGIVNTVAGNGVFGFAGDGGLATNASFRYLNGLAVDFQGNLFVAESGNNRVRKISPDGIISTFAGTGVTNGGMDGGLATSKGMIPQSVTVDTQGVVYIAGASDNGRVWKVTQDGIITRIAGTSALYAPLGDGGLATEATLAITTGMVTDSQGNVYLSVGSQDRIRKISVAFPPLGGSDISISSEDGAQIYQFDGNGRHLRTLSSKAGAVIHLFTYDANGYLAQVTDGDGNITLIERDASGNPTAIVSPDGLRTVLSLDANGYLASITNPALESTRMTYSGDGLMTEFTNPRNQSSTMAYNPDGRLVKDQNAGGGFWTLDRTELGSRSFQVAKASALGRTTTYKVDRLASGAKQNTNTFPDGSTETVLENPDGTTQTTAADGTVATSVEGPDPRFGMQAPITTSATIKTPSGLTYSVAGTRQATLSDPANLLSLVTQTDTLTINGKVFTTVYDAGQRQYTHTSPLNRQFIEKIDEKERIVATQTVGIQSVNYTYDTRGRLGLISQGAGTDARTVSYHYNAEGYVDSVTDALERTTGYAYDGAGRIKTITLPDGRLVGFTYDANGNVTSVTPPSRPAHGFGYDAVDQTTDYTPPALGSQPVATHYEYNLDKQPTRMVRPDGQTVDYGYDAGGRLASITSPGGMIGYSYQAGTGQLATVTAPGSIAIDYSYDGMLLTKATMSGPVAGSVSMAYDNFFRVSQFGVNGNNVSFSYDTDGLLTAAGSLTLARDAGNGLITGSTLGQLTTSYGYDGFGQLASFTAKQGEAVLYDEQYTRDKAGRLTQKAVTIDGQTSTYGYAYDAAGRLADVTQDGSAIGHFEYDANGNRTLAYGVAATYDDQDRLTDVGGAQYSYTANGELQQIVAGSTTATYTYDVFGNLTQVDLPDGGKLDYLVDGRHRRIGKKVNGTLTQGFLYQDQLKPAAELDGQGNVVARFVYAGKANVPAYMVKGGVTYGIITDQLGSVRLVVDSGTGQIVQRIDYDEWGNVQSDSNPGFQPFGYAGGLYDRDTGLVRFGARDYDAKTARWTAKDPIGFSGGDTSLYNYVGADPVNKIDPSGLQVAQTIVIGGGIIIIGSWNSPAGKAMRKSVSDACEKAIDGVRDWFANSGDKPSLIDPSDENHILGGDAEGGGHRSGTGNPGKSEFPPTWSDDKITGEISDVATDPNATRKPGRDGATVVIGTRDGVDIRVIVDSRGRIISGWPTGGAGVVQNRK